MMPSTKPVHVAAAYCRGHVLNPEYAGTPRPMLVFWPWLRLLSALVFAFVSIASAAPPEWVWYPEGNPAKATPAGECWLRGAFDLPAAPSAALLAITADDTYDVYVNGRRVGGEEAPESWKTVETLPVVRLLAAGRNVIAVRCRNGRGPAGLLVRLSWTAAGADGEFVSGLGWRASREASEGWEQPGFADAGWPPVFRAPVGAWPLPMAERAKIDPGAAAELRYYHERVVEPEPRNWPQRPAPAKLLCSTIWLGGPHSLTFDAFKTYVDNLAASGFNVISLGMTWEAAEPKPGEFALAFTDNAITFAANRGLWVQVRLVSTARPAWMTDRPVQVDSRGKASSIHVFTDAETRMRLAAFYRAIAARYRGYPILSYSSAFSECAETEYHPGGLWRDYSESALAHFRAFLRRRYPSLEALNDAWGTRYTSWDEVQIEFHGDGLPERPARYTDWLRQRDEAMLELNTLLAAALRQGDPQAEYAVQCGRIYSGECVMRGTVGVGYWARNAAWIITDPAPRDDVRWQSAVCRAFGKSSVAELDGLYAYERDKVNPMTGMAKQVRDGYAAGIRMMQLCHWYPEDVARYPDLFPLLGQIAREADNSHPVADEAIWAGKWDLCRAAAAGGDPVGACAHAYGVRVSAGADPDILTDDVVQAHPEIVQRYTRIEAPALTWIEPETLRLLRGSGALRLPAGRIRFQAPDGSEWEDWSAAAALVAQAHGANPTGRAKRLLAAAERACAAHDADAAAGVLPVLASWLVQPELLAGRLYLVVDFAMDDSVFNPTKSNGVRFEVILRSGAEETVLLDRVTDTPGWRREVVAADATGPAEIELVADPNGSFAWDRGMWGDVRLVFAGDETAAAAAPTFFSFLEQSGEATLCVRTPAGDEPVGRGAAYVRGNGTAGGETRPVIHAIPPYQGAAGQTRAAYHVWIP